MKIRKSFAKNKEKREKSNHVASQLYNRQVEKSLILDSGPKNSNSKFCFGKMVNGSFCSVELEHFSLSLKTPNNFCFAGNNVIKITKIIEKNSLPFFEGHIITNLEPYFEQPISSEKLYIYWSSELSQGESTSFYFHLIEKKLFVWKT